MIRIILKWLKKFKRSKKAEWTYIKGRYDGFMMCQNMVLRGAKRYDREHSGRVSIHDVVLGLLR